MFKKYYIIVISIVSSIFLMSNSSNVTLNRGDRTGSPVSNISGCGGSCHGGGTMTNPTISIKVIDASNVIVTEYVPEETYTVQFTIDSQGASAFGFQATALLNNNKTAGVTTAITQNASVVTSNNRKYFEHNGGASASNVFEFSWTAPSTGFSDVTFYATGVAANLSGNFSGDKATPTTSLMLTEQGGVTGGSGDGPDEGGGTDPNPDPTVSLKEQVKDEIFVYPNPVVDEFFVKGESIESIALFNINGELIVTHFGVEKVNMNHYSKGIYIIKITNHKGNSSVKKIVKL